MPKTYICGYLKTCLSRPFTSRQDSAVMTPKSDDFTFANLGEILLAILYENYLVSFLLS